MNKLVFTAKAEKQLIRFDLSVRRKIAEGLGTLLDPGLLSILQIKKLKSPFDGYRLRVGDYRILFTREGNEITIYDMGHRKEVYK
jgi:mRNA interferase RelE/StbE